MKIKSKHSIQGGGKKRERWECKRYIYEWDSRHGTVEKYHKGNKQHVGEFDPNTGNPLKPADPTRKLKD